MRSWRSRASTRPFPGRHRSRQLVCDDGDRTSGHAAASGLRLREVNRIFETTAWGSYRTEFYPTYDYKATGIAKHDKAK